MIHPTKETLLAEAKRIGDELLEKAEITPSGYSWATLSMGPNNVISHERSEGIYNGNSGLVLFYIELYRQTNDERYFDAAVKGMQWTEDHCAQHPTDYYAFFTGRLGVAYVMLKMHELTGDQRYIEKSITIARESAKGLNFPRPVDDLINGAAGTLLGLMIIHSATRDEELLPIINSYIRVLVQRAQHGKQGLYWDRGPDQVTGLCGFSHGAAGVGYAFLEAGRYFRNEAFYWLAQQAFHYETGHYDAGLGNWPDFRKGYYTQETYEEFRREFNARNMAFFSQPSDMAAWCHGAPGIGLSRLRAYLILKDPQYREHLRYAVEKTEASTAAGGIHNTTFTLCHGGGGNAMLFLEAYRELKDERMLELALGVAAQALNSRQEHGLYFPGLGTAGKREDNSLFMGNAGIAYFYLMVIDPLNVPSVLAPTVPKSLLPHSLIHKHEWITIGADELKETIARKIFPRTIEQLKQLMPPALPEAMSNTWLKQGFVKHINTVVLPLLEGDERHQLEDIFKLELEKIRIEENAPSHAWLNMKNHIQAEAARQLAGITHEALLERELRLDTGACIKTTKWNWWGEDTEEDAEGYNVLLRPHVNGIMEEPIMPFLKAILESFERKRAVKESIEDVMQSFEFEDAAEKTAVREVIIQQVQQAVLAGILVAES